MFSDFLFGHLKYHFGYSWKAKTIGGADGADGDDGDDDCDDEDQDNFDYHDDNYLHRMFAQKLGERYHKGRFLYINAWRNISDTPIGIHKDIIWWL